MTMHLFLLLEQTLRSNDVYDDPEIERDTFEPRSVGNPFGPGMENSDIFELLNTMRNQQQESLNTQTNQSNHVEQQSKLSKLFATKLHLVITSIIVYFLFVTGNEHVTSNNVFLYLLLWETVEMFVLKTYIPKKSSVFGIIFVLGGISQQYTSTFIKFIEIMNKVLKDVAVYIFFFVVTHLFYQTLGKGLSIDDVLRTNLLII